MFTRFLLFGVIGWCLEIIWTGFGSLSRGDFSLSAKTSVWMFFIYGCGAFFQPVISSIIRYPLLARGLIYVLAIFAVEFILGYIMTQLDVCPWDYSSAKLNIMGLIRLDYAPLWFIVGILFEYAHLRLDSVL